MVVKPEHKVLCLVVYILTLLTGLPTNVLALQALIRKMRRKATPNAILLLNLTISDLSFLAFLPFKAAETLEGQWSLPLFLCPLSGLFYFSTIYSSTLFLTAVSVERYLGVAFPLKYKMYRKPVYAVAVSCFLWVCSFAHCSIVYVTEYYQVENANATTVCYDNFTQEQLEVLLPFRLELGIVLFCIPFLITSFCYCSFVRILISSPHIRREKRQRAVGLVLTTLAVFIICFAPYNASHIMGYIQGKNPTWRDEALLFSTFNASLDPIIFYFSSSAVQQYCRHCFSKLLFCDSFSLVQRVVSKQAAKLGCPESNNSNDHGSRL
ncbi:free fatty acid receptor 2-like [Ambystoma mexicanum]|uniref:free fatty acid receptor 2-like n=1 Tax=Ambystoma mexicanum TaxID=8296 RepID=UPI0037E8E73B